MEPHKLVRRADQAMYEVKEAYYLKEGKERRRS
jgi:GGDEF domain-containing protein